MAFTSIGSLAATEMSDASLLDVGPAPQNTPLFKLFSFCSPKKEEAHDDFDDIDVDVDVDVPIKGRSLDSESVEISPLVAEEESQEENAKGPVLLDGGLVFQIGLVGAILAYYVLA
jgi:hypothetical protein